MYNASGVNNVSLFSISCPAGRHCRNSTGPQVRGGMQQHGYRRSLALSAEVGQTLLSLQKPTSLLPTSVSNLSLAISCESYCFLLSVPQFRPILRVATGCLLRRSFGQCLQAVVCRLFSRISPDIVRPSLRLFSIYNWWQLQLV